MMGEEVGSREAVRFEGLVKNFGPVRAVAGIDLEVPQGCFFGLVGPNGAGKTTTIKMATGLLRPDEGAAFIYGLSVWKNPVEVKAMMGVLPERLMLFDRLSGMELLTYNGLLRGLSQDVVDERATSLLGFLDLTSAAGKLVADYSHGMRKKVALGAALIHAPKVLFLDEPFEGIDPVSARQIRRVLETHVSGGATVILTSHVMEVVERLCEQVAVIHKGQIVATGLLDEIRGSGSLEDAFVRLVGAEDLQSGALEWLGRSSD